MYSIVKEQIKCLCTYEFLWVNLINFEWVQSLVRSGGFLFRENERQKSDLIVF